MSPAKKKKAPKVHPKVAAAGLGGAFSVLLLYLLTLVSFNPPPEVAGAITAIITTLAGFLK